ncbi:MAG: DUF3108 domain-containing protein [Pseudomonas sp.]
MPYSTSQYVFRLPSRWLAAVSLCLAATSLNAAELIPFSASYAADMRNVPVNGEATHSLRDNGDNTWTLSFNASMFVARLTEESILKLENDRVVPLQYRYERRGLGRGRETTQVFDWEAGTVTGSHRGKAFTLATEPGLLDKTTYQLALQRDLLAGKKDMYYRVADGDDIDDYHFRVSGERRVTTRVGQFDAVEVDRVRDSDSKRQTTLWFAKDFNYILVRLTQVESDGQQYRIVLKDATLDGEPVVGTPVGG